MITQFDTDRPHVLLGMGGKAAHRRQRLNADRPKDRMTAWVVTDSADG
ncbi:hypothetical protein Arub01_28170 [Actinomadura rubrobrunea]|uniref:Uncharacterized protein n=1 Tax=Actinomadura rubrobrunea TaxID=115335 RepID=A0A9W6PX35_9ACTN|nr:hypothetical protein [Actinomadura rubrobrunea]GLW64573.1 hypothetical protein Arub01_28170 [Actinomadura rubrobrunea]